MTGPEQPRTGRPALLNDERQQRIVDAVRAGNYLKVAAQWAGISERTLMSWLARGRAAQQQVDTAGGGEQSDATLDDTELPYLHFLQEVTRAETAAEVAAVTAWRSAFTEDWRAARDYLVRRRPDRWAATTRVQMTTEESERRIDDALAEALAALAADGNPDLDTDLDLDLAEAIGDDDDPGDHP